MKKPSVVKSATKPAIGGVPKLIPNPKSPKPQATHNSKIFK
jgi:hypothetical protein